MMTTNSRDQILGRVRIALGRSADSPVAPVPGRLSPRRAGSRDDELAALLQEIGKLGGHTKHLPMGGLQAALAALVEGENIRKATAWQTPGLKSLGIESMLAGAGVELVSPYAGKLALAECDLGVTEADFGFPETGTLVLRSSPDRPRMVSLLPRIHLAIVEPGILVGDLSPALARLQGEGYWVFVTGPSRTADIELTVTIGVHGPKALHVWALAE